MGIPMDPYVFEDSTSSQGKDNLDFWPKVHFSEGLRLPLLMLVHQFFYHTRVHLAYTHVNMI